MSLVRKIQELDVFKGRFTGLCLLSDAIKFFACPSDQRLAGMKGRFNGQRCFIIGLGPSLAADDLNMLHESGELCFSMNRCYQMFDKTAWRPDFYFVSDYRAYDVRLAQVSLEMERDGTTIFYCRQAIPKGMPESAIWYKAKYTDAILGSSRHGFYRCRAKRLRFSTDASRFIFDGHSVVHSIIQMAYFMGFSSVYLLGVDCGSSNSSSYSKLLESRFNKDYVNGTSDQMIEDFQSLAEEIESKGLDFHVHNAGRGGRLEVFPRVRLEDVLSRRN